MLIRNEDGKQIRTVVLTRCPLGGASEIALQKGWLKESFSLLNADTIMLQELPPSEWRKHFSQEPPLDFRDGGNVPAIWSHAKGRNTKVIGLTAVRQAHAIIVAPDAEIHRVEDLAGKTLSIPDYQDLEIDFLRAMTLRGYDTILRAYNIPEDKVRFVDSRASYKRNARHMSPEGKLVEKVEDEKDFISEHVEDLAALKEGRIDAFFSHISFVHQIVSRGLGRVLIDIAETDLPLTNNSYPAVITVDADFAEENRPLVTAYLRTLIRSARWEKEHYEEAQQIAARGQYGASTADVRNSRKEGWDQYFEPSFDPYLTGMLADQKAFLLEKGFLQKDFDLAAWLDDSFLNEALQTL